MVKRQGDGCEVCKSELNPQGKIVFGIGDLDADLFFVEKHPERKRKLLENPLWGRRANY